MKLNHLLALGCIACGLLLASRSASAGGGGGGGGFGGGGGGFGGGRAGGNFNLGDMEKTAIDGMRDSFGVADDAEWKVISDQLLKVLDARVQTEVGGGMGLLGMMARGGGGGGRNTNGPAGNNNNFGGAGNAGGAGGRPRGNNPLAGLFPASPETTALQAAIDSNASPDQLKAAMDRYRQARSQRLAKLEKAQSDLRSLLTVRQEAVALTLGLL